MSRTTNISVIMPAYNAAHYLVQSLPPLMRLLEHGEVDEVIVVDDCSTESSNVETATALGATVMSMKKNGGPGAARNFAARRAIGDIVWFVDADVIAHETGPARIRRTFDDDLVVAMFGSYDDRPPANNFASQYKNLVHRYYHQRSHTEASTFWSGCGAIRRASFLAIGGFDKARYRKPAIEDIELGHRLTDAGGRIRLVHDFLGTHLKHWSLPEVVRTDIFQRAIPWSRLMLESQRPDNDLNVSPAEKVRAVIGILWLGSLLALPASLLFPILFVVFGVASAAMLFANRHLISFFVRTKGVWFAIAGLLYHQFYYLYSTCSYAFCFFEHQAYRMLGRRSAPQRAAGKARRARK